MSLVSTAFHYYKYARKAEALARHGVHPLLRFPLKLVGKHTALFPNDGGTHDPSSVVSWMMKCKYMLDLFGFIMFSSCPNSNPYPR